MWYITLKGLTLTAAAHCLGANRQFLLTHQRKNMSEEPTPTPAAQEVVEKTYPKTMIRVKQLGSTTIDLATKKEVTVTHMNIDSSGAIQYYAQPKGLSEDGRPLRPFMVTGSRIPDAPETNIAAPMDVIGSAVTDKASGYTGTAIGLFYHIDGCVHVVVQGDGMTSKGEVVESQEFNILRLEGEEIEPLTDEEAEEERAARPSPTGVSAPRW